MSHRLFPLLLALLAACALAAGTARAADDGLVAGQDFKLIPEGQLPAGEAGKVKVVEVFAYWCQHCNRFQPMLSAWLRKRPADVDFSYVPAAFTPDDVYARAYFAAEALDALPRTHEATYRAIHVDGTVSQRGATAQDVIGFYAGLGLDRAAVAEAMDAPSTIAEVTRAHQFAKAAGVQSTPTIIVNGRYRVIARSYEDMIRITDLLVARERAAAAP